MFRKWWLWNLPRMETRGIFVVFDELALEGADPSPARLRRSGLGRLTRGPEELEQ